MHHGGAGAGDYASYYSVPQYPPHPPPPPPTQSSGEFPPPTNPIPPSYASAPPYSSDFQPAAYTSAPVAAAPPPSSYAPPPYNQNPEPSSYPQFPQQSHHPNFQPHNPSRYAPEPSLPATAGAYPSPPSQQGPMMALTYPYDPSQQPVGNFGSPMNPAANPIHSFDAPYGRSSSGEFDRGAGYFGDNSMRYGGNYARSHNSGSNWDFHEKPESGMPYDQFGPQDDGLGDGVYAYDGGRSEPYGARGTTPTRSAALFDDYGRSLSFPSGGKDQGGSVGKIVRAVPKVEAQQDVKNSVQKYRVKLLSEGGGQSTMDVLCQVGLDGIRMLDPSTSRTLRIYPLENVTRWEVTDSTIFTFWSKSSVDVEPRRIRLQSNSYTTSTILDTVTAATVQLKEMGGKESLLRGKGSTSVKQPEQPAEKKKGFIDWMNLIKPPNEEKDHWVPDEAVSKCTSCGSDFNAFNRRHHCRNCGDIFCDKCTQGRIALTADENAQPVRVCDACMAEVSQRLSSSKETANKSAGLQSHEDLARKLQEEMDRNRKSSSGSKSSSDSSGRRMREVACPICTVHLQVQVPISGSETIECGVCQHPFLVSAH